MNSFDDIRPYSNSEIHNALQRIVAWPALPEVIRFVYPDEEVESVCERLLKIDSVSELQRTVMNDAIRRIIVSTTDGFTCDGLQHLDRSTPYLFISNHRDIVLDAFLLQHVLVESGFDTTHIVFGQNLISSPVMNDMFRCNKLIRMERGGTPRAFYDSLSHLSKYLNLLIHEEHQSVWIAQKNGRAKDGVDKTAPAMLKMLCLGGSGDALHVLAEMHPVPLSVSYEWDPCDAMKASEMYQSSLGEYHKAPDEDFRSVMTGITGYKGHVHLQIGTPLSISELQPQSDCDLFDHVAHVLDNRIQHSYRLHPSNYAAYNILTGQKSVDSNTEKAEDLLRHRVEKLPVPEMKHYMLEAYAAPVKAVSKE